jgi:hypothetical protein
MLLKYVVVLCIGSLLQGSATEHIVEKEKRFPSLQKLCRPLVVQQIKNDPYLFVDYDLRAKLPVALHAKIAPYFVDAIIQQPHGFQKRFIDYNGRVARSDVWLQHITITPDGRRLFSSSSGGLICMYNPKNDVLLPLGRSEGVYSLACTDDGKQLVTASTQGVHIWHVPTKTCKEVYRGIISDALCTSDASRIYSINPLHPGRIHELRYDVVQPEYSGNPNLLVSSVAIAAQGERIVSLVYASADTSGPGIYSLWDRKNERSMIIAHHPGPQFGKQIVCNNTANMVFSFYKTVIMLHYGTLALDACTGVGDTFDHEISCLSCTDHGLRLIAGTSAGILYEISALSKKSTEIDHHEHSINVLRCAADRSRIFFLSAGRLFMLSNYLADMQKLAYNDEEQELFQQLVGKLTTQVRTGQQVEIDEQDPLCALFERYPYLRSQFIVIHRATTGQQLLELKDPTDFPELVIEQ